MFYRTTLIACCVLAAILMAAIFYNAISALIEREMSQLHTVYAINDHRPERSDFPGVRNGTRAGQRACPKLRADR
jgi:hypothetical protein